MEASVGLGLGLTLAVGLEPLNRSSMVEAPHGLEQRSE